MEYITSNMTKGLFSMAASTVKNSNDRLRREIGVSLRDFRFWPASVLESSLTFHGRANILLVNYETWWQHRSVSALRHDRPSGRFSNSRGLSAGVSFLPFPQHLAPFFARSLTLVPRSCLRNRHENACYAGYALLLLLNKHFVRSLPVSRGRNTLNHGLIFYSVMSI